MNSPIVNQKLAIIDKKIWIQGKLEELENQRYPTAVESSVIAEYHRDLQELSTAYAALKLRG